MREAVYREAVHALFTKPQKALQLGDGWVYAVNYGQIQKVKGQLYVYIMVHGARCLVQAYPKGETGVCSLEYRCHPNELFGAFELAEKWLTTYGNSLKGIEQDDFYPFNPNNKINFSL